MKHSQLVKADPFVVWNISLVARSPRKKMTKKTELRITMDDSVLRYSEKNILKFSGFFFLVFLSIYIYFFFKYLFFFKCSILHVK